MGRWGNHPSATVCHHLPVLLICCLLSLLLQSSDVSAEEVVHEKVFSSPGFILGPGDVIDQYIPIDMPTGHIAIRELFVQLVDGNGTPILLSDTYLHHWVLMRTHIDPLSKTGDFVIKANDGTCKPYLEQYYGLGSETRHTRTEVPAPYGIEVGNPDDIAKGVVEIWLLNVHAIDTRGVLDQAGCVECVCDLYNQTTDATGQKLPKGSVGGLHCCPLRPGFQGERRELFLQISVKYVDFTDAVIPTSVYILDATDTRQKWDEPQGCQSFPAQNGEQSSSSNAAAATTATPLKLPRRALLASEGPPIGQKIWLQTTNTNTYVSVRTDQTNAPLQAIPSQVQVSEQFEVIDAGGGLIALQAKANGLYVSVRVDQISVPLQASVAQVQQWEQFTWRNGDGGTISLLSAANNGYVSARSDQSNTPLTGNVTAVQAWELFRWGQVLNSTSSNTSNDTSSTSTNSSSSAATPDFGPNVFIFDSSTPGATIQSSLDSVFSQQQTNQFGTNRYAFLFKPGTYAVDVNLGFYTQALGLGFLPGDTTITGAVHVQAGWANGDATQNFWRGAENLHIVPPSGINIWAVSQACALRRASIQGDMQLDDGGYSSGGFLADSLVSGQIRSGSQQQWLSRNDQIGSWMGANWNMVFVGVNGAPYQSFPNPAYTVVSQTPTIREKPFLYVDGTGTFQVFVPALRANSSATSWGSGSPAGTSLPLSGFYITKAGDTDAQINAALSQGQNVLITPGVYQLSNTITVTKSGTVILGLGIATLVPNGGIVPMTVSDVDGVSIAGLLFDAGPTNSPILLQVGEPGSTQSHVLNPILLCDVYFRIGGAGVGKATQSLVINSNDVILDNAWIWRADHGSGVGWTSNTAANGLEVNGNNVVAYGLFVEHFQEYEVVWNGNGGSTYFFQNEFPYDPPSQEAWMNGNAMGYPAYKVTDTVSSHEAWGLGSYCFFSNTLVQTESAFEAPDTPGVQFNSMVTFSIKGSGAINHVINSAGGSANVNSNKVDLVGYPLS